MMRMEPTCSLSFACCAISFILLTSAVPFGSNFAFGFGVASNALGMIMSSLNYVMNCRCGYATTDRDWGVRHPARLRCGFYSTSIRDESPSRRG